MAHHFSEAFEKFIGDRCEEIIKDNKNYEKLKLDCIEALTQLKNSLSNEQYKLFLKYESCITNTHSYVEETIYKQGMSDMASIIINFQK